MNPRMIEEDPQGSEMVNMTKIGKNYEDFKNLMEKYTRDRWY